MKGRFHTLDAMRGLAALAVVLLHAGWMTGLPLAREGYLAVDLFFALSGYVLGAAYEDRLSRGLGFWRFFETRVVRLYPLILAGIAVGAVKGLGQIVEHDDLALSPAGFLVALVASLLMLPTPGNRFLFPLNSPFWSLFQELLINLAFGGYLFRASRGILAAIVIIAGVAMIAGGVHYGQTAPGDEAADLPFGFARVCFSFTLGLLLWRKRPGSPRHATWLSLLPMAAVVVLLALDIPTPFNPAYDLAAVGLLLPGAVYLGTRWETPPAIQRVAAFLGDVSYPIYTVHFPLLTIGWFVGRRFLSAPAFVAVFLIAVTAFGWLLLQFYDAPIRAALSRRLALRRSAPPQTSAS